MDGRYIGEIERGWHSPTIATAKRIADALDVPLPELLREL
jgi:transcriptional regulator with XRE-family HTH domain